MSMAQGHGRLYRFVIGDVKPYSLQRFDSLACCLRILFSSLSLGLALLIQYLWLD